MLLMLPICQHGEQRSRFRAGRFHALGADRLLGEQGELAPLAATAGATGPVVLSPSTHPHSRLTLHGVVFAQRVLRIKLKRFGAIIGGAGSNVGGGCSEAHATQPYVTRVTVSSHFRRTVVQKGENPRGA